MAMETQHLRLPPIAAEDYLALIEGAEQFRMSFGLPAADELREFVVSDEISPDFLALLRESSGPNPWQWGFAVIEKASELVVGIAGFKGPPDDEGMVEIAYGVVPAFENKGYATEAAGQLVAYSRNDSRVRILRAHTLPETNASTRVLEKNGFENVGTVVDPEDGPVWRWKHATDSG